MKKILFLFAILFSFYLPAQTIAPKPIITQAMGIDSASKLQKQISIYKIVIDGEMQRIVVMYRIELTANGIIVNSSKNLTYHRYDNPGKKDANGNIIIAPDMRWDTLQQSQIGQAIIQMLKGDLATYPKIDQP
jgi:hypothetical protein